MAREKEYLVTATPKAPPVHPGELLREDVLPALDMTVSDAARELRVSRQALHRILSGTMAVSPEMAVRLGKFCGNGLGCGCACRRPTTCGIPSGACGRRSS